MALALIATATGAPAAVHSGSRRSFSHHPLAGAFRTALYRAGSPERTTAEVASSAYTLLILFRTSSRGANVPEEVASRPRDGDEPQTDAVARRVALACGDRRRGWDRHREHDPLATIAALKSPGLGVPILKRDQPQHGPFKTELIAAAPWCVAGDLPPTRCWCGLSGC